MKINGNDIRLNEPYETRDGREVIITEIIKSDDYPLKGNIDDSRYSWTNDGFVHAYSKTITAHDIINLDKYNEPMKTRPHKHADLIAKLAEKLKTDHQAWRKMQMLSSSNEWINLINFPIFQEHVEYRFVPETVNINGVECLKSVSDPLQEDQYYYMPNILSIDGFTRSVWNNDESDNLRLESNLIHLTPEDAITVAKALMKPLTELK